MVRSFTKSPEIDFKTIVLGGNHMKGRKMKFTFKNVAFYIMGLLIIGLGVNFMNSAGLGVGAWDTVTINGRYLFNNILGVEWVTIGMVSATVSTLIMIAVLVYRKDIVFLFLIIIKKQL